MPLDCIPEIRPGGQWLPEPQQQGNWPPPRQDSWWGCMVRTPDGRVGRSESNPDPLGPYFLIYVRFPDGHGEWFRQATLTRI